MKDMITNFDAMPLGVYIKVLDVLEDKDRDELMTQVGLVAALSRCSEQEILDLPVPAFSERTHQLGFLETPPPERVPADVPERLTLAGAEYEIHADPETITTAQYVDYQSLIQQGRAGWPGLVALLLVPVGKGYGHTGKDDPFAYDVRKVKDAISDHMPVVQANGLIAFFLRRHVSLTRHSMMSLRGEIKKLPKGEEKELATARLRRAEADFLRLTALLNLSDGSTQ